MVVFANDYRLLQRSYSGVTAGDHGDTRPIDRSGLEAFVMDLSAAIPLVSRRPAGPVGPRTRELRGNDETTNNGCGR
jgi:hypothetical protein